MHLQIPFFVSDSRLIPNLPQTSNASISDSIIHCWTILFNDLIHPFNHPFVSLSIYCELLPNTRLLSTLWQRMNASTIVIPASWTLKMLSFSWHSKTKVSAQSMSHLSDQPHVKEANSLSFRASNWPYWSNPCAHMVFIRTTKKLTLSFAVLSKILQRVFLAPWKEKTTLRLYIQMVFYMGYLCNFQPSLYFNIWIILW